MVSLVGVFRNGGGSRCQPYIPVLFVDSPCFPDVGFATLLGNSVDNTIYGGSKTASIIAGLCIINDALQ